MGLSFAHSFVLIRDSSNPPNLVLEAPDKQEALAFAKSHTALEPPWCSPASDLGKLAGWGVIPALTGPALAGRVAYWRHSSFPARPCQVIKGHCFVACYVGKIIVRNSW